MGRRRVLTPEAKEYLMQNRHKPLHELEDRGGGVPGEKSKEGHGKMNEALRQANPRGTLETKDAGLSALSGKSVGDEYRERQKKARLEALERRRGGRQQ